MNESTITLGSMTIGIDLGDRKSHVCVLDGSGSVNEESQIAMAPKALRARFEGVAATRIALEVGGHSAWVSELLSELGHEVIVANARTLRMIFQSDSKSDRLDADTSRHRSSRRSRSAAWIRTWLSTWSSAASTTGRGGSAAAG